MFLLGLGHGECGSVRPGRYWARFDFEVVDRRSGLLIKQGCALRSAQSSFEDGLCTQMADGWSCAGARESELRFLCRPCAPAMSK